MNDASRANEPVSSELLERLRRRGEAPIIVDVRSPEEFASGHVEGAGNIPASQLAKRAERPAKKTGSLPSSRRAGGLA
jgi:rhodanese-related sulfurtransferase